MSGILLVGFLVLEGSLAQLTGDAEWSYEEGWDWSNMDWSWDSDYVEWTDWTWDSSDSAGMVDWTDWGSVNLDDGWSSWNDWDSWGTSGTFDLVDANQYWTDDASLNWCRSSWEPDRVTDINWNWMVEEFLSSGDISVWCSYTGQAFLVTDLRNTDLNKKEELPAMFGFYTRPCTRQICLRHLADKRQGMRLEDMVTRVWGYLEIFKQLDCPDCFCSDPLIRDELERVLAVAKDYLKVFEILNHSTVAESSSEVKKYFDELKKSYRLENAPEQGTERDYTYARPLITLMDMETAMAGPGAASMEITRLREMENGIAEFCKPERQIEPKT